MSTRVVNILSGGIDPNGDLPTYVQSRLSYVMFYQKEFDAVLVSSRYSRNIPLKIYETGFPKYENEAISTSLMKMGVKLPIFLDSSSTDTLGGAIFARLYLSNLYDRFDLRVVTSRFHFERAKCVYDWVFALPGLEGKASVQVVSADDEKGTDVRQIREKESLEFFKSNWMHITSFEGAFRNMLLHHNDYCSAAFKRVQIVNANY